MREETVLRILNYIANGYFLFWTLSRKIYLTRLNNARPSPYLFETVASLCCNTGCAIKLKELAEMSLPCSLYLLP